MSIRVVLFGKEFKSLKAVSNEFNLNYNLMNKYFLDHGEDPSMLEEYILEGNLHGKKPRFMSIYEAAMSEGVDEESLRKLSVKYQGCPLRYLSKYIRDESKENLEDVVKRTHSFNTSVYVYDGLYFGSYLTMLRYARKKYGAAPSETLFMRYRSRMPMIGNVYYCDEALNKRIKAILEGRMALKEKSN